MEKSMMVNEELLNLEPAEIARKIQECEPSKICDVLCEMPSGIAGRVLMEIPEDLLNVLIKKIPDKTLIEMILSVPSDLAADIVGKLDPPRRMNILKTLPQSAATPLIALLRYPPDTAGGIMTTRYFKLHENDTISMALEKIRSTKEWKPDDVLYLYVVDENDRLVGIAQVHQVLLGDPNKLIKETLIRQVKFLKASATIEEVQHEFSIHRFLGLPVVDEDGHLIGVVRAADVLQLAEKEATRDMQLMVGLSGVERVNTPWKVSVRQRLPWLYVNLLTSFLAAIAVEIFEDTLADWIALAVFLPVILSQGANAGLQTLTIVVREMALGEFIKGNEGKALGKEILVGFVCGIAAAVLVGVIGYFWKGGWLIGFVAAAAIILNQLVGAISGVLIPMVLRLLKIDPALASSVILTTMTDVAGVVVLLGGARILTRFIPV